MTMAPSPPDEYWEDKITLLEELRKVDRAALNDLEQRVETLECGPIGIATAWFRRLLT